MSIVELHVLFVITDVMDTFFVRCFVIIFEFFLSNGTRSRVTVRTMFGLRHALPRNTGVPSEFYETVPDC
jgi:hypothetical protein